MSPVTAKAKSDSKAHLQACQKHTDLALVSSLASSQEACGPMDEAGCMDSNSS